MWMETEPRQEVRELWAYLTVEEGLDLLEALKFWADEDPIDPGWHTHITDSGRELTIAISPEFDEASFARRFAGPS